MVRDERASSMTFKFGAVGSVPASFRPSTDPAMSTGKSTALPGKFGYFLAPSKPSRTGGE